MDKKNFFCLDLEENLEYILVTYNDDTAFLGLDNLKEAPFGTAFTEYLDNCKISDFVSDDLNKAKKARQRYVDLFEKGMIENLNTINNDEIYKRYISINNFTFPYEIEDLFMKDIYIEYIVHRNKLMPFHVVDSSFMAIMKAYFNLYLTEQTTIKKCENCGKYFIYSGNYNYIYCDRFFDDKGHTCKQIGPLKKRNKKVRDNPVLDSYRKAYNKKNMARARGKISEQDFKIWRERAKATLELVEKDEITMQDYFDFMESL